MGPWRGTLSKTSSLRSGLFLLSRRLWKQYLSDPHKFSRESVSNNRVKSGYENRTRAPIDLVPDAGARSGTANGIETSEPGLGPQLESLEEGQPSPLSLSRTSSFLEPQNQIPQLRV